MTYKYDDDSRRIEKTVNGQTIRYHYDGDSINVLYETDTNGNVLRQYVYGVNGVRVAMKSQGQTLYYHYNPHGDVIAMTDQSGNVVAQYEYDAWGNVLQNTAQGIAADNPFGYAGYMYDKEISMYYLMARYYNPTHGVFLSVDPDPGDEDDPVTQNGYTYGNNNPVMMVDSDGHWARVSAALFSAGYKSYKAYKKSRKINSQLAKASKLGNNYKLSNHQYETHIIDRHGPNSKWKDRSKFNSGFNIKKGIHSTLTSSRSTITPNSQNRSGYIFTQKYQKPIGKSAKGKNVYNLKVVIDSKGRVVTAYPH